MTAILEASIDPAEFALGRALDVDHDVTITLEAEIPTGSRAMPYFWVAGDDLEAFETAVERDPAVESVRRRLKLGDAALFYGEWDEGVESPLYDIAEEEGTVLSGVGTADSWEFTVRVPDRKRVSEFRDRCREEGYDVAVDRVYSVSDPSAAEFGLTTKQRETLVTALRQGYFDVPRAVSQEELAAELGVRSSAVSETLRRATAELVANTLVEPDREEP